MSTPERFLTHAFANGLTLVAQPIEGVASAAMTIALPAGSSRDPADAAGAGAVAAGWLLRGAGDRDTRLLNEALDSLGSQHGEDVHSAHLVLSTAQLGINLTQILSLYADIIRRPRLADEEFGPARDLTLQNLQSLEDEPRRKCSVLLRERFYPSPLGRNPLGTPESLTNLTPATLRDHLAAHLTPQGAIVAVAGRFDWDQLRDAVGQAFGDWSGPTPPPVATRPPQRGVQHVTQQTAQVQIALAYPAVTIRDERYYAARVGEVILSGGGSSRLFTEVREKRGLVYAVYAGYHSLKDTAGMFAYAGTTPQRAQETLDVLVAELHRLAEGVTDAEVARARTRLRSSLVMQGESTSARADALAGDWYHLGRVRGLEEISAAILAVGPGAVAEYARQFPPEHLTVLTIGPEALDTSKLAVG